MKPFVFKLQTALDLKLREEDARKETLSRFTQIYTEHLSRLNLLVIRMDEVNSLLREKQSSVIEVDEVRQILDYIPVLQKRINQQERDTEDSRIEMEQARAMLLETVRERKTMEKLREKHYSKYLQECLRQEQKEIDEMASMGFAYKM